MSDSKQKAKFGIIGAMPAELEQLKKNVKVSKSTKHGKFLEFFEGTVGSTPVVFALSNVGMVFASSVATTMIERYDVTHMIFTGVAGGLLAGQSVGDVIVARDLINYDFNCAAFKLPWDPKKVHTRGEIPFINMREFASDKELFDLAMAAPHRHKADDAKNGDAIDRFSAGRIVSGSEFLSVGRKKALAPVWKEVGNPSGVEMEGAAVAQICTAYDVPFLVLRALSDTMEGDANVDFNKFCEEAADTIWPVVAHILTHHGAKKGGDKAKGKTAEEAGAKKKADS